MGPPPEMLAIRIQSHPGPASGTDRPQRCGTGLGVSHGGLKDVPHVWVCCLTDQPDCLLNVCCPRVEVELSGCVSCGRLSSSSSLCARSTSGSQHEETAGIDPETSEDDTTECSFFSRTLTVCSEAMSKCRSSFESFTLDDRRTDGSFEWPDPPGCLSSARPRVSAVFGG